MVKTLTSYEAAVLSAMSVGNSLSLDSFLVNLELNYNPKLCVSTYKTNQE